MDVTNRLLGVAPGPRKPPGLFSPQFVADLAEDQLMEIAGENARLSRRRVQLKKGIQPLGCDCVVGRQNIMDVTNGLLGVAHRDFFLALYKPPGLFSPQFVADLAEDQLMEIAGENARLSRRRARRVQAACVVR
jgi:hypothetical protein